MLPNLTESELSNLDGLVDEQEEAIVAPGLHGDGGASAIEAPDQNEVGHGAPEAAPMANLDLLKSVDRALSLVFDCHLAVEYGASLSDLIRIRELSLAAPGDKGRRAS